MNADIAVIIPCYNSEKFISETIDSVLNQTYKNFTIICIDDCSSDNTLNILERYGKQDSRIQILKNDVNSGIAYSRNKALDICNTKYVTFLDHDDIFPPDKLKITAEYLEAHPSVGCVCGYNVNFSNIIDIRNSNGEYAENNKKYKYRSAAYERSIHLFCNDCTNGTTLVRLDVIKKNEIKFKELCGVEDYRFYSELLLVTNIVKIPKVLLYHRVTDTQYTNICKTDPEKYSKRQEVIDDIHEMLIRGFGINISEDDLVIYNKLFHENDLVISLEEKEKVPGILHKFRIELMRIRKFSMPVVYRHTLRFWLKY